MKMPPGDSHGNANEHGFYNNYEETTYFFEQVEISENGAPINPADDTNSTAAEADFSEYMWMEHMEEFDREVMKKLEEEALMEECLNFNAMLEDERVESNGNQQPATQNSDTTGDAVKLMDNLQLEQPGTAKSSTLNPLAAEFVPANQSFVKHEEPKKNNA